ncbi:hypothetical protein ABEX78_32235 [Priestia megaterium]
MQFLSSSKPRRELLERLKENLEEIPGSKYVSVKREDLEQFIKVENHLFSENEMNVDDYNQSEVIIRILTLKLQGREQELRHFMNEQTLVEDLNNLKDLEDYLNEYK